MARKSKTESKFDSLLAEPPESEAPAEGGDGGSRQRGKRSDPNYTQVSGLIPKDLMRRFKAKVVLEGSDISSKLEELVTAYLDS